MRFSKIGLSCFFVMLSSILLSQYDLQTNNGQTITSCSGTLTDSPSGNYSNGGTQVITIESPNPSEGICLDFSEWELDYSIFGSSEVSFYDGTSASDPLIYTATEDWDVNPSGTDYDFDGPGMVCSSGGPITVVFNRQGSDQGFTANISCMSAVSTPDCNVDLTASSISICQGESVDLTSDGYLYLPLLNNDFNDGTIGTGWSSSINGRFDNPCDPGLDGSTHFWIGTNPSPRNFTSLGFDVSQGGVIYFEIDFSDQGGAAPCEGPDLVDEGVYFQYSLDNGATWITIHYFFPEYYTDGSDNIQRWQGYYFNVPAAAQTANTMFRWSQQDASSSTTDHWGLDNIRVITESTPTITITEQGTGNIVAGPTTTFPVTASVSPSSTTTYTATISDGSDFCTQDITVTVNSCCVPPSVTTQPSDATDCSGNGASFTVAATGATVYQWELSTDGGTIFTSVTDGGVYSGATTASLSISDNTGLDGNIYRVVVSETTATCPVTSNNATLNVSGPPVIALQPGNQTDCSASAASFTLTASGVTGYQWELSSDGGTTYTTVTDGGVYSGSTTTTLSISDNTGLDGNLYRVVLSETSGNCPVTSNAGTLTVTSDETPVINCGALTLSSVEFTLGNALTGVTDYNVSYTINAGAPVTANNVSFPYTVNSLTGGDVVSITVTPNGTGCYQDGTGACTAVNCTSPTITAQPSDVTDCSGNGVSFTVVVTGATAYQWELSTDGGTTFTSVTDGGVYSGATTASLSISDNTGLDGNIYRVVVSETTATCPVTSTNAVLNVNDTPVITTQPNNETRCEGQAASFIIIATGATTYQWEASSDGGTTFIALTDGPVYNGSNTTTLSVLNTSGLNGTIYRAITTDVSGMCSETSNNATLTTNNNETPVISCGNIDENNIQFTISNALTGLVDYDVSYTINAGTPINDNNVLFPYTVGSLSAGDVVTINVTPNGTGCYQDGIGTCNTCSSPIITNQPTDDSSCEGSAVAFNGTGTNVNAYQWELSTDGGTTFTSVTDGGVYSGATTSSLSISDNTGLEGNMYRVVLSESGGCSVVSSEVLLNSLVIDDPSFSYDNLFYCMDENNPVPTITGLVGGTFTSLDPQLFLADPITGEIDISTSIAGGPYSVQYTTVGICPSSSVFTVTLSPLPDPSWAAIVPQCVNSVMTDLNGQITGDAGGVWTGIGMSGSNFDPATFSVTGTTDITYTVTSPAGCIADSTNTLSYIGLPDPTFTFEDVCEGEVLSLTHTGTITPTTTFTWNFGTLSGFGLGTGYYDLGSPSEGTYSVTLTVDDAGCSSAPFTASADVLPTVSASETVTDVLCNGDCTGEISMTALTGTYVGQPDYLWDNGNIGATQSGLCEGTYSVLVTDDNGCNVTYTIEVAQPDPIQVDTMMVPVSCNGLSDGGAELIIIGGTPAFNVQWTDGTTGTSLTDVAEGSYDFTVQDASGCNFEGTIDVTEPEPVIDGQIATNFADQYYVNNEIYFSIVGDLGFNTYNWILNGASVSNDSSFTFQFSEKGEYVLNSIVERDGCFDTLYTSLLIDEPFNVFVPNAFSPGYQDGVNDVFRPFISISNPSFYELLIYNRWGEQLDRIIDADLGWDGLAPDGEPYQVDVYVYKLVVQAEGQKEFRKVGHVALVR